VGERALREAIKAHLGAEILLAGPFAKYKAIANLVEALRLDKDQDQDEPTGHEEANVSNSAEQDPEQKPTTPPRSVAQLLTELTCQAANQVEIGRAHESSDIMYRWEAKTMDGCSLLISEPERDLLLAAGAEETIPDDWWDAG
jgi:hypothetical protein